MLAGSFAACSDNTIGPASLDGVPVEFSIIGPQFASLAETEALGAAFDRVDRYTYEVVDSATLEAIAEGELPITPNSVAHTLEINVPEEALGRTAAITLIAYDGDLELYRSTVFTTLEDQLGTIRVNAEIRYTGPGVRGTIRTDSGDPIAGVTVQLEGPSDATSLTGDDGTYLFVNLAPGTYFVAPASPAGSEICPVFREVVIGTTDDAIVTDFRTQADLCETRVLVMSGGDFDETVGVRDLLALDPGLSVDTTFFYINQLPSLDFLSNFDVVLLFMNGIFDESAALGTQLSDYVNMGGNVVVASFYFQGRSDSGVGSVGWGTLEDFDPFTSTGGATYQAVTLESVLDPSHPIMNGVTALTSTSYSSGVAAKTGTTVIAEWSDGAPLVGFRTGPAGQRIVGVSLFPAATQTVTGDVNTLWQNAVRWAGEIGGPS
jgi:hypothetical protein